MKKIFSVIIFSLLIDCSFGQDIIHPDEIEVIFQFHWAALTVLPVDTLLMKARAGKMNIKISEQLVYLLRAAEFYSTRDYENSSYYIQKVRINFRYPEYYNLKLLLFIGNYSNLKDLEKYGEILLYHE